MSGEPQSETPETPEVQALPPASATSEQQAQNLIDNGIMISSTDPVTGGRFLLPEACNNVGAPTFPNPTNVPAPVLTSIDPITATVASLVNVTCTGKFNTRCGIIFNGVIMPTVYVNDQTLMCTVQGGTQTAGVKAVRVVDSGVVSADQSFTYT